MMTIYVTAAWNHELECTTVYGIVCVMPYVIADSDYNCNLCFKCSGITLTLVVHIGIGYSTSTSIDTFTAMLTL